MSKRAFEKIANGLNEAIAVARGEQEPFRFHVPADVDVRQIRSALRLTQEGFAAQFGFTLSQIREWEQGRNRPTGALRAYLLIIRRDAANVRRLLEQAQAAA